MEVGQKKSWSENLSTRHIKTEDVSQRDGRTTSSASNTTG